MADYVNPTMRGLQSIQADKFPASFEQNLMQTNQSLEFLSKVVMVMQRGIDEADDTIFDDIKQLVDEIIILLGGGTLGEDSNFGMAVTALVSAMVDWIGTVPIIGDIIRFIASLFGNSAAHGSRIGNLELKMAKGQSFFDDFNRTNSANVITPPRAGETWKQGGAGQGLGIKERAARIDNQVLNASGRRWAQAPKAASSDTMTVEVIINDAGIAETVYTEIYVRASDNLEAFVYGRASKTGVSLGRGTRSGNTYTYTQWKAAADYKIGEAESFIVAADFDESGKPRYRVLVNGAIVCEYVDETVSHAIGPTRRESGFSSETRAFPPFGDRFSWGLAAYAMKSEVDPSAIAAVTETANSAVSGATAAQLAAALAAAQSDQAMIDAAAAAARAAAAQQAAEGVEETAESALDKADKAYQNAQYWKDECVVSSAGVVLGVNELVIGAVMDVPTSRYRRITDMHYAFLQKPGSIKVETRVQNAAGTSSRLVHTATIPETLTRYSYSNLEIDVIDKERVYWNVIEQTGGEDANVMQVALVGVLI